MKKVIVFVFNWLFLLIQFTLRTLKGILILSLFFYPIYLLLNYFGWISGISLSLFMVLVSALIMIRRNNSWRDIGFMVLFIGQMIFMDASVYEDKEMV